MEKSCIWQDCQYICNMLEYIFDEVLKLEPDLSTSFLACVCSSASSFVKHVCRVKLLGAEDLLSAQYGEFPGV